MLLLLAAHAHVPGYGGGCAHGCCHTPHPRDLDISQATYLRGSGGVEVDVADLAQRIEADAPIEFSVVFKREYDVSTYELYVGCGGCASERSKGEGEGWDTPNASNLLSTNDHYQPGVLEAFTQHPYFALLPPGDARMYNVSQLKTCHTHWSVRLLTHANASEDMAWSVALGCEDGPECEQFTVWERFLFPLYQVRNHGPAWNDLGLTLPIVASVIFVVYLAFLRDFFCGWWALYVPVASVNAQTLLTERLCVAWEVSLRCVLYCLIVWALLVDVVESVIHAAVSLWVLHDAEAPYHGDGIGIFLVLVLGAFKLAPLACVLFSWFTARATPEWAWRTAPFQWKCSAHHCLGLRSPFWAHGAWSLAEIALGAASLLYLGASGYWVLGFGLILAGTLRGYRWLASPNRIAVEGESRRTTAEEWNGREWKCAPERPRAMRVLGFSFDIRHRDDSARVPLLPGNGSGSKAATPATKENGEGPEARPLASEKEKPKEKEAGEAPDPPGSPPPYQR